MSNGRRFDLVASDLDGTLLRTNEEISARTKVAVHRAIGAGAMFVYATGRPPRWVDPVVADLDHYGFAVASNGAYVIDLTIDDHEERVVDAHELAPQPALHAVKVVRSFFPDVAFACDGHAGMRLEPEYKTKFEVPWNAKFGPIEELFDVSFAKLLFRHPLMTRGIYDELVEALGDSVSVTFGMTPSLDAGRVPPDGATLIEIMAPGVSKAHALQRICAHTGHPSHDGSRVLAFGDMPNDHEMLQWAEHGVAMANGHSSLKAIAQEVTLSNDEDGVARVLEREFPAD